MTRRPNDPAWSAVPDGELSLQERMAIQIERGQPDGAEFLDSLSDDDLAEFATALSIDAELKAEDEASAVPGVLPLRRPARPVRVLDRRWLAAAAVLAGVALLPFAWRATQGGAVREPSQAVAMLENPSAGLPAGWDEDRAWSGTRGAGDPLTDQTLAVRLGAYMVDLDLAIRARDANLTRLLSERTALMLSEASTSGTLAAHDFTALAGRAGGSPAELLPALNRASDAVAGVVDADLFALGAWAEAARLAARRRDAAFFREARTRHTLGRAGELVGENAEARTAITAIRASLNADSPQWAALETALSQLMRAVG